MKRLISLLLLCGVLVPSVYAQEEKIEVSGSRKAVRTSTDVALAAMPAATLAIAIAKEDWKGIAIGAAECAGTFAVTYGLKYLVKKKRPDRSDNRSFPSGHTSLAFADASFVMRRYGWQFGVPMYAVAGYVAWGRVFARKHHWWDAAAGALIGAGCAFVFTTPFARDHELSITPMADCCYTGVSAQLTF